MTIRTGLAERTSEQPCSPRKLFAVAASQATATFAALQRAMNGRGSRNPASTENAKTLQKLIVRFCRLGLKSTASEAVEIAQKIEVLRDLFLREINALLVSRNW